VIFGKRPAGGDQQIVQPHVLIDRRASSAAASNAATFRKNWF